MKLNQIVATMISYSKASRLYKNLQYHILFSQVKTDVRINGFHSNFSSSPPRQPSPWHPKSTELFNISGNQKTCAKFKTNSELVARGNHIGSYELNISLNLNLPYLCHTVFFSFPKGTITPKQIRYFPGKLHFMQTHHRDALVCLADDI